MMASVFPGSALIPIASITWTRNVSDYLLNSHFSGFRVASASLTHLRTASSRKSCSTWSCRKTRTSSMRHRTLWKPVKSSFILRWKCFEPLEMPKGSLLKQ